MIGTMAIGDPPGRGSPAFASAQAGAASQAGPPESPAVLFGSAPASRRDRRRAVLVNVVLLSAFAAAAPWAARELWPLPAFAMVYDAAIAVLYFVTSVLLYAQYRQLKEPSFLALACGYAATPVLVALHALSYPGAWGPGSLVGDEQTAGWSWIGWHGGFPLYVAVYALLAWRERRAGAGVVRRFRPRRVALVFASALLTALAFAAIALNADALLPRLIVGDRYTSPATQMILSFAGFAHLIAFVLLVWGTGLRRLIDVWLAVMLVALVSDLALSAVLVTGRYQLGWYLGRVYGLLSVGFVLAVLLREAVNLYGCVVQSALKLRESEARIREAHRVLGLRVKERTEELRQLLARMESLQDDERRRIARELHDSLGQSLSSLSLAVAGFAAGPHDAAAQERLSTLRDLLNAADTELDRMVFTLRPTALDDCGLAEGVESYVTTWSELSGLPVDLVVHGLRDVRLPARVEAGVFRVVQEALNNVARHSRAMSVNVALERVAQQLVVCIEDDGIGFDAARPPGAPRGRSGWGLLGMQERVGGLGGVFAVESRPGSGTTVLARVPLSA
jgi:signal transduction histidine kinase